MEGIELLPQESSVKAKFNGSIVATRGFIETFNDIGQELILYTIYKIIMERVNSNDGADYLQVVKYMSKKFWVIDDGPVVTFLLPEEY